MAALRDYAMQVCSKRQFSDLDAYRFIIGLFESGSFDFAHLEAWLRQHTRPDEV